MKRSLLAIAVIAAVAPALSALEGRTADLALSKVKKIYFEQLGGGRTSDQMRDMLIAAVQNSGMFAVTELAEKADAIIKGSSDDEIFNEEHSSSDSVGLRVGTSSGSGSKKLPSASVNDNEASRSSERRHQATASVRLVNKEGDVVWSTTQESAGGKFRGAMADVADKVTRQLVDDARRARTANPN